LHKIKLTIILLIAAASASFVWLAILILSKQPTQNSVISFFYVLILVFFLSVFSLIGFYLRKTFGRREHSAHYLKLSIRQGLWLSLIFVASLTLSRLNLFSLINAGLLVLTFVFLESYLLSIQNK